MRGLFLYGEVYGGVEMGARVIGVSDHGVPQPIDRYPLVPRGEPRVMSTRVWTPPHQETAINAYRTLSERSNAQSALLVFAFDGSLHIPPGQIIDIWV